MSWRALEAGAPDLAREGRARFERTHVAMLGTIRRDGSPRISPIEPQFLGGALVFGVMPSPKWDDLMRDPRCALHSSVSDVEGSEGEFKVYGRAVRTDDSSIVRAHDAWWASQPRERFEVFTVQIDEAVLVTWNADQDRMTTARWSTDRGERTATRTYP